MQYFADDIKLPPCVKCFLTCFFSCPVRSLKNTFVIVSDLGKPRRQKNFHLFGHWSTFVLVMMKLMIMLMKITMIECVEKLDEKGPIILGLKPLLYQFLFHSWLSEPDWAGAGESGAFLLDDGSTNHERGFPLGGGWASRLRGWGWLIIGLTDNWVNISDKQFLRKTCQNLKENKIAN